MPGEAAELCEAVGAQHSLAPGGAGPDQKLYFTLALTVRPLIDRAAWPLPSTSV